MALLDRFTKGVSEAADRAKFETDKALHVRRLNSEVAKLEGEIGQATMALGKKAIELRPAGLEEWIEQAEKLEVQLAAKKEELEKARAEEYVEPESKAKFCPKCGIELPEGTKFCSSCGEKIS